MPQADLVFQELITYIQNIGISIGNPLLITNIELRILSANHAFYRAFQTTADEIEHQLIADLGHSPQHSHELITFFTHFASEHDAIDVFEVAYDFPRIGQRVTRISAQKLFRTDDPTAVIVLIIEDITGKNRLSERVTVSERRYRRLFEAARDGILILDSEQGKITDANPFMTELLGYSHEELLGKEMWEIGLLKDKAASRDAFQQLKKDGSIRYENLPLESHGAETREVEFVSNLYQEGDTTVIQCNIRDITERKRMEGTLATDYRHDKKIAAVLQRTMLFQPNEDAFSGLSVQTAYSTASEEALVGGDFWDTFAFDNGHVALVCGDVMGHGLTSAVYTTELKHTMRAYIREHEQPARIFQHMNEFVSQSNRLFLEGINTQGTDSPICVSLAIIERQTGIGTLAVAAMEPPLLVRANGDTEVLKASGPPMGINLGLKAPYHQVSFQLGVGDTLVMTTDGVTEARCGKEFLGEDGLVQLAVNSHTKNLKEMGESILDGAIDFAGGKLRDDACLVLVRKT